MRIAEIRPGSVAALRGIQPGDEILSINGHEIADTIDYLYQVADESLNMRLARAGEITDIFIERPEGEDLGIVPEPMQPRLCGDDCIFCFVAQNPPGVRDTLLVKDEDYRHSLLHGSYVTLDNLSRSDFERIERQRLSPLHVSVHTLDPELRRRMLRGRRSGDIGERLERLLAAGIEIHAQIVLVPGYNDGEELERTVRGLAALGTGVASVAVVPVGLTEHREGLEPLRRLEIEEMRAVVAECERWRREYRAQRGYGFVYPSDEFYLAAGLELPPPEWYDDFPQQENGVGMATGFVHVLRSQIDRIHQAGSDALARHWRPRRILAVTAPLAASLWQEKILPALIDVSGLACEFVTARNTFFGSEVTVTGLLTSRCISHALAGKEVTSFDTILLPPNCLNEDALFLDDVSLATLRTSVPTQVRIGSYDLAADLVSLLAVAPGAAGNTAEAPDN